ncbi:hypothetical protein D0T53_01990 [Dysgonomonas sp. 216]|uniref:hypothetical protein n=1 Tax=Dysgonomonas sp. 216 TaxID=2302934 RepID=UPI0013D5619D|nr:hypothetical protein [Dysgonomonas sp. 216]NDW17685.1 hypothetical protein [Dysgonomonas sp. 216]
MKRAIIVLSIVGCLFILNFGCDHQLKNAELLIIEADYLLANDEPAEALAKLDSVVGLEALDKKVYHKYHLLRIQAKDKSDRSIVKDTVILSTKEFYEKENDYPNTAQAAFYYGKVLLLNKKNEPALQQFLDAEKFANNTDDNNLKGLIQCYIGEVNYYKPKLRSKAIERYKNALHYFERSKKNDKFRNQIMADNMLANTFLLMGERDSAFYYYDKGYEIAKSKNDKKLELDLTLNISTALKIRGDYDEAKMYLREVLQMTDDDNIKIKVFSSMSHIFMLEHNTDSAQYYIDKSVELSDLGYNGGNTLNIYWILSELEILKDNHKEAIGYLKKYIRTNNAIHTQREEQNIREIEKRYGFEQILNRNYQLEIEKFRLFIGILVVILIALAIITYYYRKHANKEKELREANEMIYSMQQMGRVQNEQKDEFKATLYQHFDILKKAALFEGYLRQGEKKQNEKLLKKFREVVYGQEDFNWDTIYRLINQMHDSFYDKIRKAYPKLDEAEVKICCLTYADLSNTEIAILMGQTLNTIQTKKWAIRKKIGVKDYGNMLVYLKENVAIMTV